MKFIREIPMDKVKSEILDLEQMGFTLVRKESSVEIWVEVQ